MGGRRGGRAWCSAFHIGTDGVDQASVFRGPGGAVLNYVDTTYGGQYAAMKLVTSGALDRHPELKVLISEGGATWVPFIGDRMNEGYRQHGDVRAPAAVAPAEGDPLPAGVRVVPARRDRAGRVVGHGLPQRDVGQRLPAPRGHATATRRRRCTSSSTTSSPRSAARITQGAFEELFPHVSDPPAA